MKPKPSCPVCGDTAKVKTQGGGTKGKYRYMCEKADCSSEWQEIPPHLINDSNHIRNVVMKNSKPSKKTGRYKCGRCGAASKKGHVCKLDDRGDNLTTLSIIAVGADHAEIVHASADDDSSMPPLALFQQPMPFAQLSAGFSTISAPLPLNAASSS